MTLQTKKVFNELGSDTVIDRQIVGGNSTGIMNLNTIKYKWATDIAQKMQNNFWLPEKVSLVDDKVSHKELTPAESIAFKNTISFLIALDSMQVNMLPTLSEYITAPEVSALLTIQAYQELVHSQSYQYILRELYPNLDREEIYNLWRSNPLLLKRNKTIANLYQQFIDDRTPENFNQALAACFVLEGIYFYSGFNFFYQLASRNKSVGTSKVIKYIENDEVTHVSLHSYIIRDRFTEKDYEMLVRIIDDAVNDEIAFGHETYGDNILGVSMLSTEQYVKYIANQRAKVVGLGVLYKGFTTNPYEYLNATKRENFFETTTTEYSQSTAVAGWDNF